MSIFESTEKNLQLLNSFYAYPKFKDGKMVIPDAICLTYRNEKTNEKKIEVIEEPEMEFYLAYEDVKIDYPLRHISLDLVEKCKCKFNDLAITLAKTGGPDIVKDYYETLKKSPYQAKKKYHYLPYVFGSDMDIEDFYKGKFLDTFKATKNHLTKAYYDIEVDGIDYLGFPDEHEAY